MVAVILSPTSFNGFMRFRRFLRRSDPASSRTVLMAGTFSRPPASDRTSRGEALPADILPTILSMSGISASKPLIASAVPEPRHISSTASSLPVISAISMSGKEIQSESILAPMDVFVRFITPKRVLDLSPEMESKSSRLRLVLAPRIMYLPGL